MFVFLFRTWGTLDLVSHSCLKTIHLLFPCQQPSRIPEHGSFPFLLLSPPLSEQPHLVVGCCDYLALLHLSESRSAGAGGLADRGKEGPYLCFLQLHSEAAGDWTRWLLFVRVGCGDGEGKASDLKCSWGRSSHFHGPGLIPQTTNQWVPQRHH